MALQFHFILVSALFLGFCSGTFGLSCYICDSAKDGNCSGNAANLQAKDCEEWCKGNQGFIPEIKEPQAAVVDHNAPPRVIPKVECPPAGFTVCRKIKQSATSTGYNEGKTEDRIIRACGFIGNTTQKAYEYRTSEGTKSEIFTCKDAGCNIASSSRFSFLLCTSAVGSLLMLFACLI